MLSKSEKFNIENKIIANSYLGKNINQLKYKDYGVKRRLNYNEQKELKVYIIKFKKELKKYYKNIYYGVK